MNKKLLICATIAGSLFLTACVKKESPTEEQAEQQVEVTETEVSSEAVAEFAPLEAIEESPAEAVVESTVDVAPVVEPTPAKPAPAARPEAAPAQEAPSNYTAPAKTNNTSAQSEDDAVADAIAAAMPALEN